MSRYRLEISGYLDIELEDDATLRRWAESHFRIFPLMVTNAQGYQMEAETGRLVYTYTKEDT